MQVRFLTSVSTDRGAFMEGQEIDLPDPMPLQFLEWLRSGIVTPVRTIEMETTLAPAAVEQAVIRRGRRPRTSRERSAEDD